MITSHSFWNWPVGAILIQFSPLGGVLTLYIKGTWVTAKEKCVLVVEKHTIFAGLCYCVISLRLIGKKWRSRTIWTVCVCSICKVWTSYLCYELERMRHQEAYWKQCFSYFCFYWSKIKTLSLFAFYICVYGFNLYVSNTYSLCNTSGHLVESHIADLWPSMNMKWSHGCGYCGSELGFRLM